jgi:sporulation protein YlmC with PRC-barrel domain
MPGPVVAADMLGGQVVDARGTQVGTIEDLMIDTRRGAIAYAMMSTVSGRDDALVAVPWSALSHDAERNRFVLDAAFTYR